MKAIGRLHQYFDFKNIRPTRFEKDFGLSNGYFGIQLKRDADIGSSILEIILNNCRDLDIEWLLTGKGLMISKNEIRIPDSGPVPEGMVKTFIDMIDRKDQKIIDQAEEIGKLKNEVSILKKQGKSTNYLAVAEP